MSAFSRHELPAYSPLSMGPFLAALARRSRHGDEETRAAAALLSTEFSADAALIVDSGCSALRLAIESALPAGPSPPIVALPAFQCYEVATAAVGTRARIALYDIDAATLQPDMSSMEGALRLGAAAIVIAPLYGLPVDWDTIAALATRYGATLIEDAAQGNGAEWNGRRLGTFSTLSVVSFGRGKGWTGGGGGALLYRGAVARKQGDMLTSLPDAGAGAELSVVAAAMMQLLFGRPSLYGIPAAIPSLGLGETRYHAPRQPTRGAAFSAALLRQTLVAATREAELRRQNASYWKQSLPRVLAPGFAPVIPGGMAGYLRFPLRLSEDLARTASNHDGRRAGIARSYPRPLGELEAVVPRLVAAQTRCRGAEALARELVTLPTHSRLTEESRLRIRSLAADWC